MAQQRDASQFPNAVSQNGVVAGAEAYTVEAKVKEVFHVNVTEEGFFPIELSVSNDTDARVLIERGRIQLISNAGSSVYPIPSTAMADEFEKNKMAYALLGFGIFSYMSAEEANRKMAADWSSKELPSETIIQPGRRASGFIYVKLPKGTSPQGMELVVTIDRLEARRTDQVRIRL